MYQYGSAIFGWSRSISSKNSYILNLILFIRSVDINATCYTDTRNRRNRFTFTLNNPYGFHIQILLWLSPAENLIYFKVLNPHFFCSLTFYLFSVNFFVSNFHFRIFAYTSEKCFDNALLKIQLTWQESVSVSAIIIIKWTCKLSNGRRSKKAVNCTLLWLFLSAIKWLAVKRVSRHLTMSASCNLLAALLFRLPFGQLI